MTIDIINTKKYRTAFSYIIFITGFAEKINKYAYDYADIHSDSELLTA